MRRPTAVTIHDNGHMTGRLQCFGEPLSGSGHFLHQLRSSPFPPDQTADGTLMPPPGSSPAVLHSDLHDVSILVAQQLVDDLDLLVRQFLNVVGLLTMVILGD